MIVAQKIGAISNMDNILFIVLDDVRANYSWPSDDRLHFKESADETSRCRLSRARIFYFRPN